MKRILYFVLTFAWVPGLAQPLHDKPVIDTSILDKWPRVIYPSISDNGLYAGYTITNQPAGKNRLMLLKTDHSWKREILIDQQYVNGFFSADNKYFIFHEGNKLRIVPLGKEPPEIIENISTFRFPPSARHKWAAYQLNESSRTLVLRNFVTNTVRELSSVDNYAFDESGKILVLYRDSSHTLQWMDLHSGKIATIWHSDSATVLFHHADLKNDHLVFQTVSVNDKAASIWYHNLKSGQTILKASDTTTGVNPEMQIHGYPRFSKNGRWIVFDLVRRPTTEVGEQYPVQVDIWSFKDALIQPEQQRLLHVDSPRYKAAISVSGTKVLEIGQDNANGYMAADRITGDFVVLQEGEPGNQLWWKLSPAPSFYLVSLYDGSRTLLKKESHSLRNFSFSPNGKYLVYYDYEECQYFSCDLTSGQINNITKSIPTGVASTAINTLVHTAVDNVAGWEKNDKWLLLYDNFDIWKVDPSGRAAPVCITNGYGARNRIKLRLCDNVGTYNGNEKFLLSAFNTTNKHNGFFQKTSVMQGDPELLTIGSYTYYRLSSQKDFDRSFDDGEKPMKAAAADSWLIKRQSATEAPNYFVTSDFKTFQPVSRVQPQLPYNWLTAELITWKQIDGSFAQGVLYKPENFDVRKKYPVIFNYYRQSSHTLYEFPYPEFTRANINIPWFVSNGYVVVIPDINYSYFSATPAIRSAYNSVVSAAQYLSSLPFVDGSKMGLQGHSWGGAETNYIITHSDLFAAAAQFAGVTDNISAYFSLVPAFADEEHFEKCTHAETAYANGATLWERKDAYLESNAILHADRISCPVLITHNQRDNQIAYRQGIELYMALRRLGKKSWLLEYKNGEHVVFGEDAKDYSLRLTQFFDHYLKGKPAPVWMTRGIPAKLKGVTNGFALDEYGICGNGCPICVPSGKN